MGRHVVERLLRYQVERAPWTPKADWTWQAGGAPDLEWANLARQESGAHVSLAWGALDPKAEEKRIDFAEIGATSGVTFNAMVLVRRAYSSCPRRLRSTAGTIGTAAI